MALLIVVPLLEYIVHILVRPCTRCCPRPPCQFYVRCSLSSEFRFVLQFRFASSSGSLLSFGSAILLIARCVSVRICCPHSQFCPRPRFVHTLVLVHFPVLSTFFSLSSLDSVLVYISLSHYLIISLCCIILVNRLAVVPDRHRCSPVSLSPASLPLSSFVSVHRTIHLSSVPYRYR